MKRKRAHYIKQYVKRIEDGKDKTRRGAKISTGTL